jgi:disulfide bond formation protein DsbB
MPRWTDPRNPTMIPLALVLASVGALLAALFFQYVIGLQPCILCIWQRWAYAAAIVAGVPAVLLASKVGPRRALLGLCGLAFLAGAGIAAFHVGVEQHWWAGTSECTGPTGVANSVEALKAQLLAAPVVRCDQVAWSLFGISMAGYNILISLALAAVAFYAAGRGPADRAVP